VQVLCHAQRYKYWEHTTELVADEVLIGPMSTGKAAPSGPFESLILQMQYSNLLEETESRDDVLMNKFQNIGHSFRFGGLITAVSLFHTRARLAR